MKNLTALSLSRTGVTDISVNWLAMLRKLTALHIVDTGITQSGVKRLKAALPNCEVTH